MRQITFDQSVNLPKEDVWEILTDYKTYPKYFKYIHKSFHRGQMKKGSIWVDLATVVYFPTFALHKVTEFEKEKRLQFYVPLPFIGGITETVDLNGENNKTFVKAVISYEFGRIFGPLFNKLFERRFKEMIEEAVISFRSKSQ